MLYVKTHWRGGIVVSTVAESKQVKCPIDGSLMVRHKQGGLVVDACPQCNGMWFAADTLAHLREKPELDALRSGIHESERTRRKGYRTCPACLRPHMSIVRVRGVEVDRCERCGGLWFDAGELAGIRTQSRSGLSVSQPLRPRRAGESLVDGVADVVLNADVLVDLLEQVGRSGLEVAQIGVSAVKGLLEVLLNAGDGF